MTRLLMLCLAGFLAWDAHAGAETLHVLAAGSLTDTNHNALSADFVYSDPTFFFLAGDANHDRSVDVNDLNILASNWMQTDRAFSQGNVDYSGDGLVDQNDLAILSLNWQQQLAAPAGGRLRISRSPMRVATSVLS